MILPHKIPSFHCILLFCLLTATPVAAQYRFDNWTTEQGLPQNAIYSITQTHDGYLWVATLDGVARFDGVRFTIFDRGTAKGLVSNRCTALFEDTDGTLWIGTEDSGVMRYRAGVFTAAINKEQGLPSNQVEEIQSDGNDGLLISTPAGLVRWRAGKILSFHEGRRNFIGRSGTRRQLNEDGLQHWPAGQSSAQFIPLPDFKPFGKNLAKFYEDRDGNLWIGVSGAGIYRVTDNGATLYAEPAVPRERVFIVIYQDQAGTMWFGTQEAGLLSFRDGQFRRYTTADGLSSNSIQSMFQDREGSLWVGTSNHGLMRLSQQFLKTYSTSDGMIDNNIYPILQDRGGRIWIGTRGVSVFDGQGFINYDKKDGLLKHNVQALAEDATGGIWIGAIDGLFRFQNGSFQDYTSLVGSRTIYAIHQDRNGTFWFGTNNGLFKWQDGVVRPLTAQQGLPGDNIKSIQETRDGSLWVGTYSGLVRFRNGEIKTYTAADGLAGNRVRSIYEDADGVLWIGTYDDGLSRFSGGRFFNYKIEHGLYNNGVFQILEDARGNFWISCNRGIYRVAKQELNDFAAGKIKGVNSVAYGKQDGMLNIECNGGRYPAGVKAADGKLWFPTQEGVVVIDPTATPMNPLPPPVAIESVLIEHLNFPFQTQSVVMQPRQNNLEINYAGLSFIRSAQVRFKYQLVGQDPNWVEAGTKRSVNYSYLRPGSYTFKVVAANSDGIWNIEGAQLLVTVLPAFYQTWWFRVLAVLGVFGGIGLIFKKRLDRAHAARRAQEEFSRRLIDSQEAERKRIARELHDGLGQDLLVIKNWVAFGQATLEAGNPARETLNEISVATSQAVENCRELAYDLRPHQMDYIGLTEALRAMIGKVGQASGLRIETQLDDLTGTLPKEAEINLFRIVQESLNNIVKHARATEALVVVRHEFGNGNGESPRVVVEIHDNGCGFDPAALAQKSRGMGLSGITERAQMLGGTALIDSAPGRGVTVYVTLPIVSTNGNFEHANPE